MLCRGMSLGTGDACTTCHHPFVRRYHPPAATADMQQQHADALPACRQLTYTTHGPGLLLCPAAGCVGVFISFVHFEVLPLVEFVPERSISDAEALDMIRTPPITGGRSK